MKAGDSAKDSLSMLLSALKMRNQQEGAFDWKKEGERLVVKKESNLRRVRGLMAPADCKDIWIQKSAARMAVYKRVASEDMSEEQIREVCVRSYLRWGIEN